jgi:LPXTG-site transpeptidase (sortase) family protein
MPIRHTMRSMSLRSFIFAALLLVAIGPMAIACSKKPSQTTQEPSIVASATAGPTSAAATPTQPPDTAPLVEFRMPKFDVSGKVVVMGVDPATNVMQSPTNKDDVAFYDFTTHPGSGCQSQGKCANTVLSGHVDWYTGQVGVFWHLKDLKEGDEVDLKLADGVQYKYKVVANTVYPDKEAPVQDIIGDAPQESVTLITCDGVFNKQLQEYNARRIVRAVREA